MTALGQIGHLYNYYACQLDMAPPIILQYRTVSTPMPSNVMAARAGSGGHFTVTIFGTPAAGKLWLYASLKAPEYRYMITGSFGA